MSISTVVIVGAGPSGLATAACLTKCSIPYILLEKDDCYASLWKKKAYDRLHLHVSKKYTQLPYVKIPKSYPKYISKGQFVEYLDNYVDLFDIRPLYRRQVETARFDNETGRWRVMARNGGSGEVEEYVGRFLVVASGESSIPFCPEIDGLDSFAGKVMHSAEFRNGSHIIERDGMVRIITISSSTSILSKLVYGDFSKHGLRRPSEGPLYLMLARGKYPVIDVGTFAKIKSGDIQVLPAVKNIRGNYVAFQDERSFIFDKIIFATGFRRATNKWLQGDDYLLNEDGMAKQKYPNHWKGKNGLYCVGFSRMGLTGLNVDSQKIAKDIKSLL